MNEHTATALAYGIYRSNDFDPEKPMTVALLGHGMGSWPGSRYFSPKSHIPNEFPVGDVQHPRFPTWIESSPIYHYLSLSITIIHYLSLCFLTFLELTGPPGFAPWGTPFSPWALSNSCVASCTCLARPRIGSEVVTWTSAWCGSSPRSSRRRLKTSILGGSSHLVSGL